MNEFDLNMFTHGVSESGSSSEAVQQSQVSSSKPSLVGADILGSLLLEVS